MLHSAQSAKTSDEQMTQGWCFLTRLFEDFDEPRRIYTAQEKLSKLQSVRTLIYA